MTNDANSLPQTPAQSAFARTLGDNTTGTNPDYDPTQRTQKPKYNLTFSHVSDANIKEGDSDKPGDATIFEGVARAKDGYVIAARADIITPPIGPKGPKDKKGKQFDTAINSLTIGQEGENYGVYGKIGFVNGKALDRMYGVVDRIHQVMGMTQPPRRSPPSSPSTLMIGIAARNDFEIGQVNLGPMHLGLQAAAFGELSTVRTAGGGGVFLTAGQGDFKPDLPGMPASEIKGSTLYAGVIAQGVAKDIATDKLGTNSLQVSAVAGAALRFNEYAALGVSFESPLTNPVKDSPHKPVPYVGAKLNISF
jgi:hypothetical protein